LTAFAWNFWGIGFVFQYEEEVMKAYFTNLSAGMWVLLALPAVAIAYPIIMVVGSAVVRAVVPEVVRTVLHLM
jgi:hypothetical protein